MRATTTTITIKLDVNEVDLIMGALDRVNHTEEHGTTRSYKLQEMFDKIAAATIDQNLSAEEFAEEIMHRGAHQPARDHNGEWGNGVFVVNCGADRSPIQLSGRWTNDWKWVNCKNCLKTYVRSNGRKGSTERVMGPMSR